MWYSGPNQYSVLSSVRDTAARTNILFSVVYVIQRPEPICAKYGNLSTGIYNSLYFSDNEMWGAVATDTYHATVFSGVCHLIMSICLIIQIGHIQGNTKR